MHGAITIGAKPPSTGIDTEMHAHSQQHVHVRVFQYEGILRMRCRLTDRTHTIIHTVTAYSVTTIKDFIFSISFLAIEKA